MILPIHFIVDSLIYIIFNKTEFIHVTSTDLILIFSASLIDLDHLFSKPIYKPGRDSFKTHFLHKRWHLILLLAIVILFFRKISFLGIGLISHLFLDYIDNKINYTFKLYPILNK